MKKSFVVNVALFLFITFGFANSFAQTSQPSAKATAKCGDLSAVELGEGYNPIFIQTINTPNGGDLFVDVSLECGMTTNLRTTSRRISTAPWSCRLALRKAEVTLKVNVLVDGMEAEPGEIIFARRKYQSIAQFAGDISECISIETVEIEENEEIIEQDIIVVDQDCIQPETLELLLDTMTANSFTFIAPDLSSGKHTIVVQAKFIFAKDDGGCANIDDLVDAMAYLRSGSVTIERVRMIKEEDIVVDLE